MKKLFAMILLLVTVVSVISLGVVFRQAGDRTEVEAAAKSKAEERLEAVKGERPEEFQGEGGEAAAERYLAKFQKEERLNEMLRRDARAKGVQVSQSEFEETFNRIARSFEDTQQFAESLKEQGTTIGEYKEALEMQLLKVKLLEKVTAQIKVSSADVRDYYDNNLGRFADPANTNRTTPFGKVSEMIKEELTKERKAARFQEYIEGLTE